MVSSVARAAAAFVPGCSVAPVDPNDPAEPVGMISASDALHPVTDSAVAVVAAINTRRIRLVRVRQVRSIEVLRSEGEMRPRYRPEVVSLSGECGACPGILPGQAVSGLVVELGEASGAALSAMSASLTVTAIGLRRIRV
ncbi:hypothetical protein GCM10020255_025680 [Rhodococcus baikonurensis]